MNCDSSTGLNKCIMDTFQNIGGLVGSCSGLPLPVPISDIPAPYNNVFSQYVSFNTIQSAVFEDAVYTDNSLAISAPTGSGKTVIFELAIIKFLISNDLAKNFKIIYIAPMKAICEERLVDWHNKFNDFGINCISVTGDSENVDMDSLNRHNLIITTPEKWDVVTRRWRDNDNLIKSVKLFLIDEIHLVNDESRGATLEAIVTRMKTVYSYVNDESNPLRFIGVSATVANIIDIAQWFNTPNSPGKHFQFKDDVRPVKLQKIVIGYPYNPAMSSPFKFDIMLSYKLHHIILQYSCGKPTLVFCSTRKSVELTSKQLIQNLTISLNNDQKKILVEAANTINNPKVTEVLIHGVGCHHAGMLPEHRRLIESLFRDSYLAVLITTSTLAMGVNLPAHLVVVKSTKYYTHGEYRSYEESMIFQMIGRAGRPQFDTSGTAVIMTTNTEKHKFENMISGEQPIESYLRKNLVEFINAEAVLQTITNITVAMQWLSSTFLYIRARKNPKHYGLPLGLSLQELDKRLLEMCQIEINKLCRTGMLTIDSNETIQPTESGRLMAKYCVCLETMKLFTEMTGYEQLQQVLGLISKCYEFQEIRLRSTDKSALNILNKCRNKQTIRFPLSGKIRTLDMKINCIVQAVLGCLEIKEPGLLMEAQRIMRIGERLLTCVAESLKSKENCYQGLLNTIILCKCFRARIWENSYYVSRQLDGIGSTLSSALVIAGKTSFDSILEANPRDLERTVNKKPPFGNTLQEQVKLIPKYSMKTSKLENGASGYINIEITLENAASFEQKMTVNPSAFMYLIVGDGEHLLLYKKYSHLTMTHIITINENIEILRAGNEVQVSINWISEDWAGFDIVSKIILFEDEAKKDFQCEKSKSKTTSNAKSCSQSKKKSMLLQQSMDKYFSNVKPIKRKRSTENNIKTPKTLKKGNKISEIIIEPQSELNNKSFEFSEKENQIDSNFIEPNHVQNNLENTKDLENVAQKIVSNSIASYIRSVNKKVLSENVNVDNLNNELISSKINSEAIENCQKPQETLLNIQKQIEKPQNSINRLKKKMISNRNDFLNSTRLLAFEASSLETCPVIKIEEFSKENKKKLLPKQEPSQKSISWKSPLIDSTIQKHSPHIEKQKPSLDLIRRKFNFPPSVKEKLTYSLADKNWEDNKKKCEEFVSKPLLDLIFGDQKTDDLNVTVSSNASIPKSVKTTVAESVFSYNQMGGSYMAESDRIKSVLPMINDEVNQEKKVDDTNLEKKNDERKKSVVEKEKSWETDFLENLDIEQFFIEIDENANKNKTDLESKELNQEIAQIQELEDNRNPINQDINQDYQILLNKYNNQNHLFQNEENLSPITQETSPSREIKEERLPFNNYGLHQNRLPFDFLGDTFQENRCNSFESSNHHQIYTHQPKVLTQLEHLNLYEQGKAFDPPNYSRQQTSYQNYPKDQNEYFHHHQQSFPINYNRPIPQNQHHHQPSSSYYQNRYDHCRSYPTSSLDLQRQLFDNDRSRYFYQNPAQRHQNLQQNSHRYQSPYFQDYPRSHPSSSFSYPYRNEGWMGNQIVRKPRISPFETFEGFNHQGELDFMMPLEPRREETRHLGRPRIGFMDDRRSLQEERPYVMRQYFDAEPLNDQFERMKRKYDRFDGMY